MKTQSLYLLPGTYGRKLLLEVGNMGDNSSRVLCVRVDAKKNLVGAVVAAAETVRALEAQGYAVKGLEIRGHLLRKGAE